MWYFYTSINELYKLTNRQKYLIDIPPVFFFDMH
jgi:hypothetical protein